MPQLPDRLTSARALRALDRQVDLISFWRSPYGIRFADGIRDHELSIEKSRLGQMAPGQYPALLADGLDRARTYYVTAEMQDAIDTISNRALPSTLEPHEIPAQYGYVELERPVVGIDTHDMPVSFSALQWFPIQTHVVETDEMLSGFLIVAYSDPYNDADPRIQLSLQAMTDRGISIPPRMYLDFMVHFPSIPVTLLDDDGQPILVDGQPSQWASQMVPGALDQARWLTAFWLLSQQKIAGITGQRPDRAQRRRLDRSGISIDEIRIVTLRRREQRAARRDADADAEPVHWTHRWWVEGHWRHQWYPSDQLHRWIYIDDHIRGPEDRPLIAKDSTYKVSR